MKKALMKNEENRWSYMTNEEMERRLFKITNLEKLECFINCADKYHNPELKMLALEKLDFMNGRETVEEEKAKMPRMVVLNVKSKPALGRDGFPKFHRRGRVHMFIKDFSVLEDFLLRATDEAGSCDEVKMFRRDVLPEVMKKMDLPDGTKFGWSRKAGCSCGCSPGFICKTTDLDGLDVFVDYDVEV